MKKILSKSQANQFLQCPFKWKKCYIDKIRSIPSPAQRRGINIHSKIEKYYNQPPQKKIDMLTQERPTQPKPTDPDLDKFFDFDMKRIEQCIKYKKVGLDYLKPLYQELRLKSEALGLKGICDAVYKNPEDDGIIIVDWKTGKYYPNKFDDYRFELAVYAELLREDKGITPKYWSIYFTDQDELFFEKIDTKYIDEMHNTMAQVREDMAAGFYPPKKNQWCFFCQFKKQCPLFRK